jgi:hypothetical protein
MASNKRPPLELDDLTNNLKQSSGKGVDAFFSSLPQEKKKPAIQEEQEKEQQKNSSPVPVPAPEPVPAGAGVRVGVSPSVPLIPKLKRVIRQRQPFDIYEDQYQRLKKIADDEKDFENGRGMSQMVRIAIDNYLKEHGTPRK